MVVHVVLPFGLEMVAYVYQHWIDDEHKMVSVVTLGFCCLERKKSFLSLNETHQKIFLNKIIQLIIFRKHEDNSFVNINWRFDQQISTEKSIIQLHAILSRIIIKKMEQSFFFYLEYSRTQFL